LAFYYIFYAKKYDKELIKSIKTSKTGRKMRKNEEILKNAFKR
jgi:hypothetical protein